MEPEPTSTQSDIRQHVSLSAYEWHQLLRELEDGMRIINRDQDILVSLYEKIASQLYGNRVTVERRKQPTAEPIKETKNSFWSKFKK